MKTLKQVQKEIAAEVKKTFVAGEEKERKKSVKRVEFLRIAERYLETEPRKEFVQKQFNQVSEKLIKLKELFSARTEHIPVNQIADVKRKYETENDMPTLRIQLKTLNYLLA